MHFLAPALLDYTVNGPGGGARRQRDPDMAPHGVYPAAGEDRWVAVACQDDAAWPALCAVMARPDLAADRTSPAVAGRLARRRTSSTARWRPGRAAATAAPPRRRCRPPASPPTRARQRRARSPTRS